MNTVAQYESNLVPMPPFRGTEGTLSEAFSSFISAADVLERSYRDLQEEVGRLRLELQESHGELARSLRENEQMRIYLSGIVESLPCGVIVLDAAGRPKMTNQEADKLLPGRTAESLRIFSEAVRQSFLADHDYEVGGAEGQPRNISVKRAALAQAIPGDQPPESVVIVRDVTEQRKLEKERENHRRMQSLAEISAMLAHEIRNPLAGMELFASLLADTLTDDTERMQWVRQMQAGHRLLSATVNNVLQFYSEAPARLFPVDLRGLVEATIEMLRPVAQQHEVEILFESAVQEIYIDGDSHKLQQIFFNLALNAFRAMQPGQALILGLRCVHDSVVQIQFCDQGCGIPAEDLNHIFQPGFTRGAKGPGLGLAVCKRMMQQHGATIAVLSAPGVGSTFTLEFPAIRDCQ